MPKQAMDLLQPLADQISPPPDWNSPTFIDAFQQLMTALGQRYDADPRLGFVDVGGYGTYGEWNTGGVGAPITLANAKKLVQAVLTAFPHHSVVVNTMKPELVVPILAMSPRIGVRMDCLGADFFGGTFDAYAAIRDRWKTAPVITEWCHTPNETSIQRGAAQVLKYHVSVTSSGNAPWTFAQMYASQRSAWRAAAMHAGYRYEVASLSTPVVWHSGVRQTVTLRMANVGSAPTYDNWRVQLRLVRSDGTVASWAALPINLKRVLPGIGTVTAPIAFTAPRGTYTLTVAVLDPSKYAAPMALATAGRTSRGDYPVGVVRVG
jgi:hypothetical protein